MKRRQVVIVGAGAAGLIAGRELVKAGNQVIIVEARNRTGGRIYPLDEKEFGYPAQGGAEFIHGAAPLTRSVAREAGLTLSPRIGEVWNAYGGKLSRDRGMTPQMSLVREKLRGLKKDITIADFLNSYFGQESHAALREAIERMVEGYDAADPFLASTFALRDEWMGDEFSEHTRIKEGYGALINFLEFECKRYGAQIQLATKVETVDVGRGGAKLFCSNGKIYESGKVLVTIPLPLLSEVTFLPPMQRKMEAARNIGFGGVIKILLKFRARWWLGARGRDLSRMFIVRSNEAIPTWWTQYPQTYPVLTGWLSGPKVKDYVDMPSGKILDIALSSIAKTLNTRLYAVERELVTSRVVNWTTDAYARGAYTYGTLAAPAAREELLEPFNNVFFSGEALYRGKEVGTVEAALVSGAAGAQRILASHDG